MAGVSVKLEGIGKLRQALLLFQAEKRAQVKTVVAKYGLLIETEAKRLVPVDTGILRASIHLELTGDGLGGRVGTDVIYAPIQELGSRYQAAQPFLFPAAEKYRYAFKQELSDALRSR